MQADNDSSAASPSVTPSGNTRTGGVDPTSQMPASTYGYDAVAAALATTVCYQWPRQCAHHSDYGCLNASKGVKMREQIIRPRRGDLEAATQPHPFRSSGEYVGPARVEVCDLCGLAQRTARIHLEETKSD